MFEMGLGYPARQANKTAQRSKTVKRSARPRCIDEMSNLQDPKSRSLARLGGDHGIYSTQRRDHTCNHRDSVDI